MSPQPPRAALFPRFFNATIVLFYGLSYLFFAGARDLFSPDETRYGAIPQEMIYSGDWLVPHLNGLRYFEKPVLGYWVHALSMLLFGENRFALRLPSVAAMALVALLVFWLVKRATTAAGRATTFTPGLAALIFLSCFGVYGIGNTVVLDNLFTLFVTASVFCFFLATEQPQRSRHETALLLLAGCCCGLAFLTKGFLAFVVPILALAPYLWLQGRFREVWRLGLPPIGCACLVALPWAVAIHLREPDYWHFFIFNEHLRRFIGEDAQHKQPFWFYLTAAPLIFLPWIGLVPTAIATHRGSREENPACRRLVQLAACWFLLPFLFFSLAGGKLLTYLMPCVPPFAIWLAMGLMSRPLSPRATTMINQGLAATMVLVGLIITYLISFQLMGLNRQHFFERPWQTVMLVNTLVFLFLALGWAIRCHNLPKKLAAVGFAPVLFFLGTHFLLPDTVLMHKAPSRLLAQPQINIQPNDLVVSDDKTLHAVCWTLRRNDIYLIGSFGELGYGIAHQTEGNRALDGNAMHALIRENPGRVVFIGKAKDLPHWQALFPRPSQSHGGVDSGFFVWRF